MQVQVYAQVSEELKRPRNQNKENQPYKLCTMHAFRIFRVTNLECVLFPSGKEEMAVRHYFYLARSGKRIRNFLNWMKGRLEDSGLDFCK